MHPRGMLIKRNNKGVQIKLAINLSLQTWTSTCKEKRLQSDVSERRGDKTQERRYVNMAEVMDMVL